MGLFRTTIAIENPAARGQLEQIRDALVATGSEFTWIPAQVLERLGIQPERTQQRVLANMKLPW